MKKRWASAATGLALLILGAVFMNMPDRSARETALPREAALTNVALSERSEITQTADSALRAKESSVAKIDEDSITDSLARADAGDPVHSCRIARTLARCRLSRTVDAMAASQFEQNVRDESLDLSRDIARLERISNELSRQCEQFLPEQQHREWWYLAQSAQAGNAQSLFEFVIDPFIDTEHPLEYAEALLYYREHAPEFIDRLVAMHSIEGLSLAFQAAAGELHMGNDVLQERNTTDLVAYGTALRHARGLSQRQQELLDSARLELSPQELSAAEYRGRQLGGGAIQLVPEDDDLGLRNCSPAEM